MTSYDESLKKLLGSSCINLASNEDRKKKEFERSLPHSLEEMVDTLFDDMTPFIFE